MRTLFWLIGIFALAAGLAMLASLNTGYVQVVTLGWRVQLSLNFLILALVVAFAMCYLALRLVGRTLAVPGRVGAYRERRRRDRGGRALREALRASFEGRFAQAIKHAATAFSSSESPSMAALVAARAAHAMRDDTRYRIWMGRATEQDEDARVARLMTEAELAVEGRRFDEAAEHLEALRRTGHRHIAVLRLSLRVASELAQWEEALRLARQLRKHKALSEEQARPVIRRTHLERMRELGEDGEALAAYWKTIPADELSDRRMVEKAIPMLAAAGRASVARKTLERLLDTEWDSALAHLYAACGEGDAVGALARAEGWLEEHPKDAGLLYALGRLCLAAQLWGKAQSYLEVSLKLAPSVETHLALAGLLERLDRTEEAQGHYRAAAQLSAAPAGNAGRGLLPVPVSTAAVSTSRAV